MYSINKNQSFRRQIILRTATLSLSLYVILYLMISHYVTQVYTKQLDTILSNSVQNVSHNIYLEGNTGVVAFPYSALDGLKNDYHDYIYYNITENEAHLMGYTFLKPDGNDIQKINNIYHDNISYQGVVLRRAFSKIKLGNNTYIITLASTQKEIAQKIATTIIKSAVILFIIFALFLLFLLSSIKAVLNPFLILSEQFNNRKINDFSDFTMTRPQELKILTTTINNHMRQLKNAWDEADLVNKELVHQIRTPLAILKGQLETAAIEPLDQDRKDGINKAITTVDKTVSMTDQLLHESYLTHSLNTSGLEYTPLSKILLNAYEEIQYINPKSKITFEPPKNEINLYCNHILLAEAIKNILNNACQYSNSENSRILLHCHIDETAKAVIIHIADNGIGVDPKIVEQLFNPFVRQNVAHKTNTINAGLGLYSSQKIIKFHDGKISLIDKTKLKSIDNTIWQSYCGAIFVIELPIIKSEDIYP